MLSIIDLINKINNLYIYKNIINSQNYISEMISKLSSELLYIFDKSSNELKYKSSYETNEISKLILNKISLPDNYKDIIPINNPNNIDKNNQNKIDIDIYNKITIINSAIDKELANEENDDAFFVLPSQLNGAEYPSHYTESIVTNIFSYKSDGTGGPRGQFAVHHAVGQFILDNAFNDNNKNGINGVKYILDKTNDIKLINGYLEVPEDNNEADKILDNLNNLIIIGMKNVLVNGQYYNQTGGIFNNETEIHVNMIYASAIPIFAYTNYYTDSNLLKIANYIMIAEYYGSLECAYWHYKNKKKKFKIYLMPLGGGCFNNEYLNIKINIITAIKLMNHKYNDWKNYLEIHILLYKEKKDEYIHFRELYCR